MTAENSPLPLSQNAVANSTETSPGALIRRGRERARMSVDELAAMTKLGRNQIDALERDDFSSLLEPVYVRGYYRKCAKILGLNDAELITAYDTRVIPKPVEPPSKLRLASGTDLGSGTRLPIPMAIVAAAFAVIVCVFLWNIFKEPEAPVTTITLTTEAKPAPVRPTPVVPQLAVPTTPEMAPASPTLVVQPSAVPATPETSASTLVPTNTPTSAATTPLPAPVSAATVTPASAPTVASTTPAPKPVTASPSAAPQGSGASGAASVTVTKPQTASPVVSTAAAKPQAPPASVTAAKPQAPSQVSSAAVSSASTKPAVSSPAPSADAALLLSASITSWVRVEDNQGKTLINSLLRAGEKKSLSGVAPYKVFLGNAPGVRLEYKGKVQDISGAIAENLTARITIPAAP